MARGEEQMVPQAEPRSYYGRPVIKAPVWTREVPWYLFAGGLTGTSAALSFAAEASGNSVLARRAWFVTLVGGTASPALLVSDLGRPERFLNMLRVVKPTSPMSIGSWVLAATGAAAGLATASDLLGSFPRLGRGARLTAALLGLPLSTYTAALLSNTAVPVWHEARRELPFVFAGSAAASAGAAATILTPVRHAGPARTLAIAGSALEGVALGRMERRLGPLAAPYRSGPPARYGTAAKGLTAAGAAVLAAAGRSRLAAVAGGALVLAGAALERWSVFSAGFESARDPVHTVGPQRERLAHGQR